MGKFDEKHASSSFEGKPKLDPVAKGGKLNATEWAGKHQQLADTHLALSKMHDSTAKFQSDPAIQAMHKAKAEEHRTSAIGHDRMANHHQELPVDPHIAPSPHDTLDHAKQHDEHTAAAVAAHDPVERGLHEKVAKLHGDLAAHADAFNGGTGKAPRQGGQQEQLSGSPGRHVMTSSGQKYCLGSK